MPPNKDDGDAIAVPSLLVANTKTGNIRRRSDNSWTITIDTGQRDTNGKRLRKYETVRGTRSDAEKRRREMLVSLDRGEFSTTTMTVSDWLKAWMRDTVVPNRRLRTVEQYQGLVDRHINPGIGELALAKVRPFDIQHLETRLLEKLHPNSIAVVHQVLSGAFKVTSASRLYPRIRSLR